jgi:alkylated DNA repair protein alkB homolog 6
VMADDAQLAASPRPSVVRPASLDRVRVEALPPAVYYISDFISEDEERAILDKVRT